MKRYSYSHALRAKGIKPIPPYHKLRSSKVGDQVIDSRPATKVVRVVVPA